MIRDRPVFGFGKKALREGTVRSEVTCLPFRTRASNCWGGGKNRQSTMPETRKSLYLRRFIANRCHSNDCSNSILVFRPRSLYGKDRTLMR